MANSGALTVGIADVASHADDLLAIARTLERDQRQLAVVIDLRKAERHLRREPGEMLHETQVPALDSRAVHEGALHGRVLGSDRTDAQSRAARERHRRLELRRIRMDRHVAIAARRQLRAGIDHDARAGDKARRRKLALAPDRARARTNHGNAQTGVRDPEQQRFRDSPCFGSLTNCVLAMRSRAEPSTERRSINDSSHACALAAPKITGPKSESTYTPILASCARGGLDLPAWKRHRDAERCEQRRGFSGIQDAAVTIGDRPLAHGGCGLDIRRSELRLRPGGTSRPLLVAAVRGEE